MPTYLVSIRAPRDYKGSADAIAAWNAWFDQLGSHLESRGNPVFERSTLGNCDVDTVLGGFCLISADSFGGAVALAETCPMVADRGGVEVGELTPLN